MHSGREEGQERGPPSNHTARLHSGFSALGGHDYLQMEWEALLVSHPERRNCLIGSGIRRTTQWMHASRGGPPQGRDHGATSLDVKWKCILKAKTGKEDARVDPSCRSGRMPQSPPTPNNQGSRGGANIHALALLKQTSLITSK